jgi:ubiquinol-cytochrome c reductase cytochrome b subunit
VLEKCPPSGSPKCDLLVELESQMSAMQRLKAIGAWIDKRLQLGSTLVEVAEHPVPRSSASWWYVFGSATLVVFTLQVVTGICLATVYTPAANRAWDSLIYLDYQQPLGWYLRALHGWGSNFMVALMLVHMAQVFLFGAYKYPRELTWVAGCVLLLSTLGMAFTGQVLRFDQNAYWGLGIGASIAGRFPIIGSRIVRMLLGGPIIAGETLSRFFALHVFVIPGLLIAFVGLHLFLVLRLGINEWPMPGRIVRRDTYLKEYQQLVHTDGEPFIPFAAVKDLVFAGLIIMSLLVVAAVAGPIGPNGQPDPTIIQTVPRPDFFFLWLFSLFALLPPWTETFLMLVGPPVVIGIVFALPFISGTGEKSWRRRPFSVVIVLLAVTSIGTLTWLGTFSPWSPVMDAWSAAPTPADYVKGRSPLELQGAILIQSKQCRNCHSLGGEGGMRGPALDDTATRLTRSQIVRQIIQGGGNMPAYGKNLSPAEVNAIVAFLSTMHPRGEPPARDSAKPAASF